MEADTKKIVIWLLGSNGSGKTTQCKNILDYFNGLPKNKPTPELKTKYVDSVMKSCYTVYRGSGVAVLGVLGKNQCTGLDSVYSKIGADGVVESLKNALNDKEVQIILVECVFGTFSWYENWVKAKLRDKFKLIFIHLEMSLWENYRRIQWRRAKKLGVTNWKDIELEDTVYKNVGNKNRETRVIYQKLAGQHEKSKVKLADIAVQFKAMAEEESLSFSIITFIENNI